MTERRKNQSFTLLFIDFITVNKYRFCISVIGYINVQIIGIGYKKINISRSLDVRHVTYICYINIVTYYFLATVISYITFSSRPTEVNCVSSTLNYSIMFIITYFFLIIWPKSTLYRSQKLLQTLNSDWWHSSRSVVLIIMCSLKVIVISPLPMYDYISLCTLSNHIQVKTEEMSF